MTNPAEELFSKEAFDFSEYFIKRMIPLKDRKTRWHDQFRKALENIRSRSKSYLEQMTTNDRNHLRSFATTALRSVTNFYEKLKVQVQDISVAIPLQRHGSVRMVSHLGHIVCYNRTGRYRKLEFRTSPAIVTSEAKLLYNVKLKQFLSYFYFETKILGNVSECIEIDSLKAEQLLNRLSLGDGNNDKYDFRKIERKNYAENTSADELDLDHPEEKIIDELNSGISSVCEDEHENFSDVNSDKEFLEDLNTTDCTVKV
ncbi:2232_t:CDS:2 [Ambispora gerdemannii]|uniref:2232_t:CDS:1 n=1 Tax=Ambispora gerdemannii TaxID=144530 RepID=A0A9N9DYW7_9GLOM|nr:2232_t:CDS:2 [Ambispora gerdemannii]